MRKIITIVIASFILNNCGYTPIYSSKEKNFYIEKITQKSTSKLNSKIANNLKIFSNENSENIIQIEINSVKTIKTIQKDDKGDPSRFQMTVLLDIKGLQLARRNILYKVIKVIRRNRLEPKILLYNFY